MKEGGFTLIEVIIAFTIFLVIASVIPHYFNVISFDPKYNQRIETSIFFQQLANEVNESIGFSVNNNILYLKKSNGVTVSYGFFQQRIRRQVNNQGQEVALQNVDQIEFSLWNNGIDIRVKDKFNQIHEKRITHLLPLKDMSNG